MAVLVPTVAETPTCAREGKERKCDEGRRRSEREREEVCMAYREGRREDDLYTSSGREITAPPILLPARRLPISLRGALVLS